MAGDNQSDSGDRAGDGKAGELTRVIDGASKSAMDEVLEAWRPPPTSKTFLEKASDFVSHLSIESLPALSTNLLNRVTGKTEGQEHGEKQIKETSEEPQDKPTKHIYQSVEIETLAKKGDPVAIDTVKMLDKVGDNKDWRTSIKEAYTNVVTQFRNFITGGDRQLQEVPQVISGSQDAINEARFQANIQEGLKPTSTSEKSPDELIAEAKFTYNPDDQGNGSDSLPAITNDSSEQLEGHITKVGHVENGENNPLGWLKAAQKIAQLPLDKQLQVIGAGLSSGVNEYNYQYRERSIGALIGTVQGVGTLATNLGKVADFSAYLLLNDHERAGQMGAEFGEALGTSIVSGAKLFEGAHHYLNDVGKAGYEGDYTKAFRDIDNLGKHLDKAWSELPPREQNRIISKLGTELAGDGLIGLGAAKAAGKLPGQFTKILDTVSSDAQRLHQAGKTITHKSVRSLEEAIDPLVKQLQRSHLAQDATDLHMPEVPKHLRHLELQPASPELLSAIESKGRKITFAQPGSDDMRYLQSINADGSALLPDNMHILLKENSSKIAALEEFLHGTQKKIGVIDRVQDLGMAEVGVKDFMIRHRTLLGLSDNDVSVLEVLKQQELDKLQARGWLAK